MELTPRDRKLIEDIALHHVMTREQIVKLGYFTSVSRANRRLLTLVKAGLLERVTVNESFASRKALYRASKRAGSRIDQRVAALLASRRISPLQLDHSLAVVDVRIKLKNLGLDRWISEPQCRHSYTLTRAMSNTVEDVRPDGISRSGETLLFFVEVDRGTVSIPRVKEKLASYRSYACSGMLTKTYGSVKPLLLFVTTGSLRKRHLLKSIPKLFPFPVMVQTALSFQAIDSVEELDR